MTRAAVARALGISIGTVRRLEGDVLHPVKADDGYWYFDAQEIETARSKVSRLRARRSAAPAPGGAPVDGELAARLFPLFARGATFEQTVQQTQISPPAVRALYWEWRQGYHQPAPATTAPTVRDDDGDALPEAEEDDESFAAWEAEVRALDREQARIERLARRYRRRWADHL
jgi:hypothetical protein